VLFMRGEEQGKALPVSCDDEPTKMLGAHVPEEVYWEFKAAAGKRKEQLKDALCHAARMYIDAGNGRGE
jgi:hypothetical protein